MIIADHRDKEVEARVMEMVDRFGGNFQIETGRPWKRVVSDWKTGGGLVVHLTAYGLPLPEVIGNIRESDRNVLVVVGSEKMPGEMFRLADWNVSVTSQPMSEIAALAVFLDWFHQHSQLDQEFARAKIRIIPSRDGKKIQRAG